MKLLVKIHLVQFFLYEKREVSIGQFTGVFGANGSGKSSLLDAVQIVMLGANQSRGRSGVVQRAGRRGWAKHALHSQLLPGSVR
jgi:chromosome segregation protein